MLSVEILGEDGTVEDTLVSYIYVPSQILNAQIFADKYIYKSKDTLILTLENEGPTTLFFGYSYAIEMYRDKEWTNVPFKAVFSSVGLRLLPKHSFEQKISLEQLQEPGLYRILKEVDADGTDLTQILVVEFEIVE